MVLEKLIITRSINDIEMKYTYSLTKESLNNVQAYGIKVERVDIKDGAIINRVEDGVKYISTQRHKVKGLLNLLLSIYQLNVIKLKVYLICFIKMKYLQYI